MLNVWLIIHFCVLALLVWIWNGLAACLWHYWEVVKRWGGGGYQNLGHGSVSLKGIRGPSPSCTFPFCCCEVKPLCSNTSSWSWESGSPQATKQWTQSPEATIQNIFISSQTAYLFWHSNKAKHMHLPDMVETKLLFKQNLHVKEQ